MNNSETAFYVICIKQHFEKQTEGRVGDVMLTEKL